MISYLNGDFLPSEETKISPFDRGFMFADGVYEVIRTYNGNLFRFDDHLKRLKKSLSSIKLEYDLSQLETIIYQLIDKNNLTNNNCFVYIQITRGTSIPRSHHFSTSLKPTIFISATKIIVNESDQIKGINVITYEDLRWQRCDIKSISLLPAVLANQLANEKEVKETILYKDGLITEGTYTNFFAIKNSTVFTAPEGNRILSGITRKVILELCIQHNIKFVEDFIKLKELQTFEEFFITSTTKEITPVVEIDNLIINNGRPGELTIQLQSEFKKYRAIAK